MNKESKTAGFFITLEGIEGVGKSTAVQFVNEYLKSQGKAVLATREPGGTPVAEAIRQVLLHTDSNETLLSETELMLMFAGRAQHLGHVIIPALQRGEWVVCDRFTDASFAYQGGGRGMSMEAIAWFENWVQKQLRPNMTILLDAPVELALTRAKKRSAPDRFEQETKAFFERVRECYLQRAKAEPKRFHIVDATLSIEQVQKAIQGILQKIL